MFWNQYTALFAVNRILLRIYLLQQIIVPTVLHNINQPSISTISRIFTTRSVSRHGKGEVDHVWGLAKCFAHRYVGTGGKVLNITDCKDFLGTKFAQKPNPKFFLKLIDIDDVANSRGQKQGWKNTWRLKSQTAFKSWFFNLISQPLKLPFTYVSVTTDW